MNRELCTELKRELHARGFTEALMAPHESVFFSDEYLSDIEIADLVEIMVSKRDKAFFSIAAIGRAAAEMVYDDTVLVIEAVKAVIGRMSLMNEKP